MENQKFVVYPYRWIILFVFSFAMAMQQLLWITFASITTDAKVFYHVTSDIKIGMLSMVFMIVYIIVSIPSSWLIDTYGFRAAVSLGAILTGVFGFLRGMFATNYDLVLICQIGIALGQPLIVNSVTKIAARWFPKKERATASGIAWLAGYLGLIVGLALTPFLINAFDMPTMLYIYGIVAILSALLFLIFAKEFPPTAQGTPEEEERSLVFNGMKQMLSKKQYVLLAFIFFIGLGIFNGFSTWIENILAPRGFTSQQAGIAGGVMIACGIFGSFLLPLLSDKFNNRSKFLFIAMAGSVPGLIGITYANSYWLLLVSAGILGFFMLSAAPIGFQYGSELAYPAPEGTSTGVLMMMGQASGILFILGMDYFNSPTTGMKDSMTALILLLLLTTILCVKLQEPEITLEEEKV